MDHQKMEAEFIRLARLAGNAIMDVRNSSGMAIARKSDGSPVTEADHAADRIIRDGLERSFGGVHIVSEESPESHSAAARCCFIVDPLDGTRGFARGSNEFTVNIAYVADGRPRFGVVGAPAVGRMFCTSPDGGAIERRWDGTASSGRRIGRHGPASAEKALKVIVSHSAANDERLEEFLRPYHVASVGYQSSSLKFCLLAAGEADLYPRFGPTMEWDTAAGHAVLSAVGGEVLRLDDRSPLAYGKPGYENPAFVAGCPGLDLMKR